MRQLVVVTLFCCCCFDQLQQIEYQNIVKFLHYDFDYINIFTSLYGIDELKTKKKQRRKKNCRNCCIFVLFSCRLVYFFFSSFKCIVYLFHFFKNCDLNRHSFFLSAFSVCMSDFVHSQSSISFITLELSEVAQILWISILFVIVAELLEMTVLKFKDITKLV